MKNWLGLAGLLVVLYGLSMLGVLFVTESGWF